MPSHTNVTTDEIPSITDETSTSTVNGLEEAPMRSQRATRAGLITVAKVSHTLSVSLADRLEEFAFRQRVSESAVIEYALNSFFSQANEDALGERLRESGAGRRRRV
jgi:predicted transcriptional regulator